MVNKKQKLYSTILALCLTLALMATGVWAILQQSVGVSTTVTFTATSVKGTINGEVEGGYAGVTTDYETTAAGGSDALTGAEIVQFGTKYVFANITGTNSSWNGKEAYYVNEEETTEKVGAVTPSATIASATTTNYTVSNKSYVSSFSPTSTTTDWTIADMVFQADSEGQASDITLTLTIENTGSNVIGVSFPNDLGQWSDAMTASSDNLSVTYQSKSTNPEVLPTAVEFSATNVTSIEIPSNETGTIVITLAIEDESSSISSALNIAFQLKLEKGVAWAGSVAPSFAAESGTGNTSNDAYLIENAEQLAYLASAINAGTLTTTGKYFKLVQPITLNNYTQIFDEASGLVLVKNNVGTLECCLGTGIKGTAFHATNAGTMGAVYAPSSATDDNLTTGTIPADLKVWTPIGNSTYNFQGTFDGNGYTISGLYINSTTSAQGLFGYATGASIKNVSIANTYIKGDTCIGGIAGFNLTSGTLINVHNTATVLGTFQVGGVSGHCENITLSSNFNNGVINGNSYCGGIIGNKIDSSITSSFNTGFITGGNTVGGLVGYTQSGVIADSNNTGNVYGSESYIGGITGHSMGLNNLVNECFNTGNITGGGTLGGVVGFCEYGTTSNSFNYGTITGGNTAGGVVGKIDDGTVGNSYNTGNVTGGGTIGGVVGSTTNCVLKEIYNTGIVTGNNSQVGGVVGKSSTGSIINSFNSGNVIGTSFIGGVIGQNSSTVWNCFNLGSVTGSVEGSHIGGIIGLIEYNTTTNCYNVGIVNGGSLVGSNYGTVSYSHSLSGTTAIITQSGTINNLSQFENTSDGKTTLLNSLNTWVTTNQTTPAYKYWTLTGSISGYPIFA